MSTTYPLPARLNAAGGGGGGAVEVQENGATVVAAASTLNFQSGVVASSGGPNLADINVDYGGAPVNVTKAAAAAGAATTVSRSDHKHDVSTAIAVELTDSSNTEGAASTLARSDHTHAHGSRGGGTLHAVVTPVTAGFMSGADKTKLDGIAPGATATPLTATAPVNVNKSAAVVGVSVEAARADHKHDIDTAVPSSTGTANSEGAATTIARSDHVHRTLVRVESAGVLIGTRPTVNFVSGAVVADNGGSDRVDVTVSGGAGSLEVQENGVAVVVGATIMNFQSGIVATTPGGTTADINVDYGGAPVNVTKAAASAGAATTVSRSDHKHDISTAVAVTVGTANAEGAATTLARSDHVHDHGTQPLGAGTQHAVATTTIAGFLSAADKTKIDALMTQKVELVLFSGLHSTNGTGYVTVARMVINFDKLPSSGLTMRWNQVAVPANSANVRLRNITDAVTLGSAVVAVTGLQSFAVTNPTGTKLVYLQHEEVVAGAGTSDIEGAVLES